MIVPPGGTIIDQYEMKRVPLNRTGSLIIQWIGLFDNVVGHLSASRSQRRGIAP